MHHSPYCGFCTAVSYVYLTVAHYLSDMDHMIFVRIDGDNNDLPWEYSMNRFPSILFFPAKRYNCLFNVIFICKYIFFDCETFSNVPD